MTFTDIVFEAMKRFPHSPSRRNDFIRSWQGIQVKRKRHNQESDWKYGTKTRHKRVRVL